MFGDIIVSPGLIQIHVSHLSFPYLVIEYQNKACHVFNLLSLTCNLEVTMHDSSALINREHELHETSNNSRKAVIPECGCVKLKNGRNGWRQEWGRMEIVKEVLSLSPSLVPWGRDNLQWEKSSRQNNSAPLSVLLLSLPASKDIHPYPSSVGHESSGRTLQAPKASSHPEEKGQSGLWGNWDKFVSVFLSAGRRKGQGALIALLGWVNPLLRLSEVKPKQCPKQRLYFGGQPKYINRCQSILAMDFSIL